MNVAVDGICGNPACLFYDREAPVSVDVRELPDGWGWFDGEFGVCDACNSTVSVSFDLQREDLEQ